MERLTKRDENGNAYYDFGFLNSNHWSRGKHIDRLAAFEDTGLEPKDFKKVFNEDAVLKLAGQVLGTTPFRLLELAEADKDGRLVVLPCPFYSEVYALSQVGKEIVHGELRSTNKDYCLIVNLEGNLTSKGKTWHGVQVKMQDVFLTRAEADAALKGDAPNE